MYQRYLGWYDGNPANLWPHPPVEAARRSVDARGGPDAAVAVARRADDEGDYRWVVEVCKHILFADETNAEARAVHADALEQIGFGTPTATASPDLMAALTVDQVFDSIAIRVDGPKAWDEHVVLSWVITDTDTTHAMELRNGVLSHRTVPEPVPGSTTFILSRARPSSACSPARCPSNRHWPTGRSGSKAPLRTSVASRRCWPQSTRTSPSSRPEAGVEPDRGT